MYNIFHLQSSDLCRLSEYRSVGGTPYVVTGYFVGYVGFERGGDT